MHYFDFTAASRKELLDLVEAKLEEYYSDTKKLKVSSEWDVEKIRQCARVIDFNQANEAERVVEHLLKGLQNFIVHTPHPNYFGLFNPRTNFASILGDLISATFNPQLAAWSHSPFANEIENYIIQEFGKKFGYPSNSIDGTFCTGGAEANLTGVICALNHFFPEFNTTGIRGIQGDPVIYCSSESHHSIVKAAKIVGLGAGAVKSVAVNQDLQMDIEALREQIRSDRQDDLLPFMLVGTAGTTGAGAIDDLKALHRIATDENLWFHVDAAYGGGVIVSGKYKDCLSGIERSDSITLDLHKWFSVPMGASLFLTSNKKILHRSFAVQTKYMPKDGDPDQIADPYVHSIQWSRRFIGLKAYLPLAIHGWQGYEEICNYQIELGILFKENLEKRGWEVLNQSHLPIVCFSHQDFTDGEEIAELVRRVNNSGQAWLSTYPVRGRNAARVCFNNYQTSPAELDELIALMEEYKNQT